MMAAPTYVNRVRLVSSLDKALAPQLDQLSKDTRIPKSRLLDMAVEDLLAKFQAQKGNL